jgi:apolipoprotein N-acyltransferase
MWIAALVLIGRGMLMHFGRRAAIVLIPMAWLACEYFRSEVYWLRFSWLIPGYVFSGDGEPLPVRAVGVYGVGFVLALGSVLLWQLTRTYAILTGGALVVTLGVVMQGGVQSPDGDADSSSPIFAGVQLEFPSEVEVIAALEEVVSRYPQTEIVVLSEYTFTSPPPERVRAWCRERGRYLIVGGVERTPDQEWGFYNTAFVVGPSGEIVFTQAKSVPIQFFADGSPAERQRVWESPWGKIGICVCYDLSYTRVTDELVRQGARMLVVPTMDVTSWGAHQHELHGRVAPARAAEYGIPIVRLCSSGISQIVDERGRVHQSRPFPGQGEIIAGRVAPADQGRLPADRYVAWAAMAVTGAYITVAALRRLRGLLPAK